MEFETLTLDIVDRVATVSLNRPPVNAQNAALRAELLRVFDVISVDDEVSVAILTGTGDVFSAGADIKERGGLVASPADYLRHNRLTRDSFYAPADCAKPVIAAINGPAIGAGYALAACCDILIASDNAWVQMPELDRGLLGGAQFLREHFSRSRSRLLFFTGRKIDAAELYRLGVIDELTSRSALMQAAQTMAREIAAKSPLAIRKAKAAFTAVESMPVRDGYRFEQTQTFELSSSEDAAEGRAAFLAKRSPRYRGR